MASKRTIFETKLLYNNNNNTYNAFDGPLSRKWLNKRAQFLVGCEVFRLLIFKKNSYIEEEKSCVDTEKTVNHDINNAI